MPAADVCCTSGNFDPKSYTLFKMILFRSTARTGVDQLEDVNNSGLSARIEGQHGDIFTNGAMSAVIGDMYCC
jgi:hypothetical protein